MDWLAGWAGWPGGCPSSLHHPGPGSAPTCTRRWPCLTRVSHTLPCPAWCQRPCCFSSSPPTAHHPPVVTRAILLSSSSHQHQVVVIRRYNIGSSERPRPRRRRWHEDLPSVSREAFVFPVPPPSPPRAQPPFPSGTASQNPSAVALSPQYYVSSAAAALLRPTSRVPSVA